MHGAFVGVLLNEVHGDGDDGVGGEGVVSCTVGEKSLDLET
jgi:hypothetical protein